MNLINWFKNDWKVIEVLHGKWYMNGDNLPAYYTVYEILFSPSKEKYKLKCSGYRHKEHPMYSLAIKKLNEYESNTTTTSNS